MNRELDVELEFEAQMEGCEAKDGSLMTDCSGRLNPNHFPTVWAVKLNIADLDVADPWGVKGTLLGRARAWTPYNF